MKKLFSRTLALTFVLLLAFSALASSLPSPSEDFYYYDAAGVLEIVVLLFRRWAEPGASEEGPAAAAAPAGRFDATPATLEGDENLDVPTFLRRRINFDPD